MLEICGEQDDGQGCERLGCEWSLIVMYTNCIRTYLNKNDKETFSNINLFKLIK